MKNQATAKATSSSVKSNVSAKAQNDNLSFLATDDVLALSDDVCLGFFYQSSFSKSK